MTAFADRVHDVPTLGIGIAMEYGATTAPATLDPVGHAPGPLSRGERGLSHASQGLLEMH
jgi:hypothetical protein